MSTPSVNPDAFGRFYDLALQHYVAARASLPCGVSSVVGNQLHHAVEMLLKGELSKTIPLEHLKDKPFGHKLPRLWAEFKGLFPNEDLSTFDTVISELDRFDFIRYPDAILHRGAIIALGFGRGRLVTSKGSAPSEPQYQIGLGDIDDLFARLFPLCRMNPKAYFSFLLEPGRKALTEDNDRSADWLL